ncbi:unnamed protein product [Cunninghamella echinulata]
MNGSSEQESTSNEQSTNDNNQNIQMMINQNEAIFRNLDMNREAMSINSQKIIAQQFKNLNTVFAGIGANVKVTRFPNNYDDSIRYTVSINGDKEVSWGESVKMYSDGNKSCKNDICIQTWFESGYITISYGGYSANHPNTWEESQECAVYNPKKEKCAIERTGYLMGTKGFIIKAD